MEEKRDETEEKFRTASVEWLIAIIIMSWFYQVLLYALIGSLVVAIFIKSGVSVSEVKLIMWMEVVAQPFVEISFLVFFIVWLKKHNLSFEEVWQNWSSPFSSIFALIGLAFVFKVMLSVLEQIVGLGVFLSPKPQVNEWLPRLIVDILLYGLLSPIKEEFLYRGILYRVLRSRYSIAHATIYSSLIFMALYISHNPELASTFFQFVVALVVGITACLLFEKHKSLTKPVIFHIAFNTVSTLVVNLGNFLLLLK